MNNANIINIISKEITDFESGFIYIADKVKFSQYQTVKKILTHQNNGFEKPSKKYRIFTNIGNSRRDTCVKKVDFDTKDINLYVDDPLLEAENLLLKSEIRQYLKDTNHGVKLNECVEVFVDWGNVVCKEDEDDIYRQVNIANLKVIDQSAECLEDTTVIEEHRYTVDEFRRNAIASGWNNYEEAIKQLSNDSENNYIYVYERYGELNKFDFLVTQGKEASEADRGKYINCIAIIATERPNPKMRNAFLTEQGLSNGEVLFIEELKPKKFGSKTYYKPYREAHYDDYQGRWLRKGIREKLFEYQDRANELSNQIREAMKWSSLHLFWSSDSQIAGKNILEGLEQGQIIQTSNLNVLPVEERNLSAQINEWNKLMDLADREAQSFEVATGEGLPSGTTLGQVEIQTATVGEHFDYKREKLALLIKQIFNDWVLPEIVERLSKEHNLEITGSPEYVDRVMDIAANGWFATNYLKMIALSGGTINKEQWEEIKKMKKEELMKKPKLVLPILADYYKGILPKCDIVITGENVNKQSKINNGMAIIGMVQQANASQDPSVRSIAIQVASLVGFDVQLAPMQQPQQPQQGQPQTGQQTNPGNPQQTTKSTRQL